MNFGAPQEASDLHCDEVSDFVSFTKLLKLRTIKQFE